MRVNLPVNIFVTDQNPEIAAKHLDDVRLRKMILETAQMCATALRERWGIATTYKSSHKNHPCNVWARETPANLMWLLEYGLCLYNEYRYRWEGKTHKSGQELERLFGIAFAEFFQSPEWGMITPFVNCARRSDQNINFTHMEDTHDAYRQYLNCRWDNDKREPKWTNRGAPEWRVSANG